MLSTEDSFLLYNQFVFRAITPSSLIEISLKNKFGGTRANSTVGIALALHAADKGSVYVIPYGPQARPGAIFEPRVKNKNILGMAPQKNKMFFKSCGIVPLTHLT